MNNDSSDADSTAVQIDVQLATVVTLQDLCSSCNITTEFVGKLVEFGALEPVYGNGPFDWQFHSAAIPRSRIAMRLHSVFEVNPAGSALILDLLDELTAARARLRLLEQLSDSSVHSDG